MPLQSENPFRRRPSDLQKALVRMWLFGIVTIIEMRCTELIERHCPTDTWKTFASEARLQKAQSLLGERRRRSQNLQLFGCPQFSDKGQIIARNEEIRKCTIFCGHPGKRGQGARGGQADGVGCESSHGRRVIASCRVERGGHFGRLRLVHSQAARHRRRGR